MKEQKYVSFQKPFSADYIDFRIFATTEYFNVHFNIIIALFWC